MTASADCHRDEALLGGVGGPWRGRMLARDWPDAVLSLTQADLKWPETDRTLSLMLAASCLKVSFVHVLDENVPGEGHERVRKVSS